jgi:AbrB family looped-hinge helix DNA binding protein
MKISAKNQVTIPVAVLEEAELAPGDELEPVVVKGDIVLRRRRRSYRPSELTGIARRRGHRPLTDEEIARGIAEGACERKG